MELPAHPESEGTASGRQPGPGFSWGTVAVFVVIAALLVVIVVLHLTGAIGPETHAT